MILGTTKTSIKLILKAICCFILLIWSGFSHAKDLKNKMGKTDMSDPIFALEYDSKSRHFAELPVRAVNEMELHPGRWWSYVEIEVYDPVKSKIGIASGFWKTKVDGKVSNEVDFGFIYEIKNGQYISIEAADNILFAGSDKEIYQLLFDGYISSFINAWGGSQALNDDLKRQLQGANSYPRWFVEMANKRGLYAPNEWINDSIK